MMLGTHVNADPLPLQALSDTLLRERYCAEGERDVGDIQRRVANAISQADPPDQRASRATLYLWAQQAGFVPGGRINASAGLDTDQTLINCFVQPCPADSSPSIERTVLQVLTTLRAGGGVGYDLSLISANEADLVPGVLEFLQRMDSACLQARDPPHRRCAQMAVLRCDHPDILAFIQAKDRGQLTQFNLSVAVTDHFMSAVAGDTVIPLKAVPAGRPVRWVRARLIWDALLRSAFDHGEPGVLFLDRIQRDNNLSYCEKIEATNPCGEAPLPPFGACDLGSIDLTRFVISPFSPQAGFDFYGFRRVIRCAVRMLDNVLAITHWPLPQQQTEALSKRRLGLGVTGLADCLIMLGLRYDTEPARHIAAQVVKTLRDSAYAESVRLARERGPFPRFDAALYVSGEHAVMRLPGRLRRLIQTHGIRNSHLLALAPAGTISLAFCDNVANGIEPVFGWTHLRHRSDPDGTIQTYRVENHAWRLFRNWHGPDAPLPDSFVTAREISPIDHVRMVTAVSSYVDGGISKTVNLASTASFEDFRPLFETAWRWGLKGLTCFRPNPVIASALSEGGR